MKAKKKFSLTFNTKETLSWLKARAECYDAKAQLKYMSPDEFLRQVPSTLTESLPASMMEEKHFHQPSIEHLMAKIQHGEVLETPYLDYSSMFRGWASHEGRHRAFVAKKLGIKKIPVVVVKPKKLQ